MLRYIIPILMLGAMTSCEEPVFDRIPGQEVKNIPKDLQGTYTSVTVEIEGGVIEYSDSAEITVGKKSWTSVNNKGKEDKMSDLKKEGMVFSEYKGKYFLNHAEKGGWNCLLIDPTQSGFNIYPTLVSEMSAESDSILGLYFSDVQVKEDDGDKYYFIKMKEEELIKFDKEFIGDKYYIRLTRTDK